MSSGVRALVNNTSVATLKRQPALKGGNAPKAFQQRFSHAWCERNR